MHSGKPVVADITSIGRDIEGVVEYTYSLPSQDHDKAGRGPRSVPAPSELAGSFSMYG